MQGKDESKGTHRMNWLKLTNAFTSNTVHIKVEHIAALYEDTHGTLVELQSGGRVTVKESADAVKGMIDKSGTPKKKEIETR
jgi:hypothetical protein